MTQFSSLFPREERTLYVGVWSDEQEDIVLQLLAHSRSTNQMGGKLLFQTADAMHFLFRRVDSSYTGTVTCTSSIARLGDSEYGIKIPCYIWRWFLFFLLLGIHPQKCAIIFPTYFSFIRRRFISSLQQPLLGGKMFLSGAAHRFTFSRYDGGTE